MSSYYNEHDKFAAAWLRELIKAGQIADGEVDERDIQDVQPSDLAGFTQCHFFAGIGGWSLALRLAGWPDDREVWSGSCPCPPFSSASNRYNTRTNDERHLWPAWSRLMLAGSPDVVFGEQTAQAGDWFTEVCADMEGMGFDIGAAILPAVAVGFDHARARLYFVGDSHGHRQPIVAGNDSQVDRLSWRDRDPRGMVPAYGISRVLAGFGNAIVPQVAQAFIEAYLAVREDAE